MVNLSGERKVKPMTISLHHTTYKLNKKKGSNSDKE